MSTFVMSGLYPEFCNAVRNLGHIVIETDSVEIFHKPERTHADMQLSPIKDKIFILNECKSLVSKLPRNRIEFCESKAEKEYPKNILLNCLLLNNTVYGKLDYIDKSVIEYCCKHGIKLVNVNQGYARCSTLVINEKAVITSDKSIEKALKNNGVEVLLISPGSIKLDGFDYGFIGGCGAKVQDKTVFFGNIEKHPDYNQIIDFCKTYNSDIEILCKHLPLTDIGGMVEI